MADRRVVVVTGASAGVGRATARAFAREGAWIGLLARGVRGLQAARREVEALGGRAIVIQTDVSRPDEVEAAAARVERELGPIDVWVNNAMVSVFSPFAHLTPQEFRRVTEVTYLGYVYGTMSALRRMRPRDRGVIVQVGSTLAYRSIPLQSAYCGAKHAIVGFTESLRSELLHDGSRVRVTMVQLPGLNTPQFDWIRNKVGRRMKPVGRIYQPEVAAEAILWASKHDRRELLVGWPVVQAVLADKLAPGLLDRYLASYVYRAHVTDEPDPPGRVDNLYAPVPVDRGAHGSFDALARERSLELWAAQHRPALLAVGGALLTLAAGLWLARRAAPGRG